jgi:hypothetical protein
MIIHKFTPFIPANIQLEVDNQVHDIFVLVSLTPVTVQVPDEGQYALVKDRMQELVKAVGDHFSRPVEIDIPTLPEAVMKEAKIIQAEAHEREQQMRKAHAEFEQERAAREEEFAATTVVEEPEGDSDAL